MSEYRCVHTHSSLRLTALVLTLVSVATFVCGHVLVVAVGALFTVSFGHLRPFPPDQRQRLWEG